MNSIKPFLKKLGYIISANGLNLIITTVLLLIVPRYIGVTDYSYWQLYVFYTTYTAYLSLGLTDGIFIRYAGEEYENLDFNIFRGQFWIIIFFNILIIFLYSLKMYFMNVEIKDYIILYSLISSLIVVPRSLITFTLQATGRIKDFSIIITIEKVLYFLLTVAFLFLGQKYFFYLILIDLISKSISLIISVLMTKELVVGSINCIKRIFYEAVNNFNVGYKILLSNLSSMFIVGINRILIERNWSIQEFGKVSLALSLSNMMSIFTNAISIVLFPVLNKWDDEKLKKEYPKIRFLLVTVLLIMLLGYFPLQKVLIILLPKYQTSIQYMSILLPIIVFETKTVLLLNTYLKAFRKEKVMLRVNMIVVIISLITGTMITYLSNNVFWMILALPVMLGIRAMLLEFSLSQYTGHKAVKANLIEILFLSVFSLLAWNFPASQGFYMYLIMISLYIIVTNRLLLSFFSEYKTKS